MKEILGKEEAAFKKYNPGALRGVDGNPSKLSKTETLCMVAHGCHHFSLSGFVIMFVLVFSVYLFWF